MQARADVDQFGRAKIAQIYVALSAGTRLGPYEILGPIGAGAVQGKEVDARSDLFSFDCVLYEMLTGKRAFEGSQPA